MKSYNFEQLIGDELKKNSDQILNIDAGTITPMEIHMEELERNIKRKKTNQKSPIKLRLVSIFSIIFIVLIINLLWETPTVKAFRFNVVKSFIEVKKDILTIKRSKGPSEDFLDSGMNEDIDGIIEQYLTFEEAKRKIPFDYIQADYIPKDFIAKDVHWNQYLNGDQIVVLNYEGKNGKFINILQEFDSSLEFEETMNIRKDAEVREINIKGKDVLLISIDDKFSNAIWYEEAVFYEIIGSISEDEIIKIIESLH